MKWFPNLCPGTRGRPKGGQENKQKWRGQSLRKGKGTLEPAPDTPFPLSVPPPPALGITVAAHPHPTCKNPPHSGGIMRNPQFFHTGSSCWTALSSLLPGMPSSCCLADYAFSLRLGLPERRAPWIPWAMLVAPALNSHGTRCTFHTRVIRFCSCILGV